MPVREALRQLEAQGLVLLRTHRGAVVISMRREKLIELLNLRILLECDVLSQALQNFRETDFLAADEILKDLKQTNRDIEISQQAKLNWAFHNSLYIAANRPETLSIIESIYLRTGILIRQQLIKSGEIHSTEKDHGEILRLCRARDPAATDHLRHHIGSVIQLLSDLG